MSDISVPIKTKFKAVELAKNRNSLEILEAQRPGDEEPIEVNPPRDTYEDAENDAKRLSLLTNHRTMVIKYFEADPLLELAPAQPVDEEEAA